MGLAKFLSNLAIPAALLMGFGYYSQWGFGSVFAGIGVFCIINFLSYLLARGRDFTEIKSSASYRMSDQDFVAASTSDARKNQYSFNKNENPYFLTGLELASYVGDLNKEHAETAKVYEIHPGLFIREITYLDAFAIDFAAYQFFGNSLEKEQLLDGYYEGLSRKGIDLNSCQERLIEYANSLKMGTPDGLGIFYEVGKKFASFCGEDMNPIIALHGTNEVSTTSSITLDAFKKIFPNY